jgi:hypothetical protein
MKLSDSTEVGSITGTDHVIMIRPVGQTWSNIRASASNFLSSLLATIGIGDVPWAAVDKTGSSIADLATKSHTNLTDIGTNTHAQIDSFIAANSTAKIITFAPIESIIDVAVGDGTIAFTVPPLLNGYNLVGVLASVHTLGAGTGATTIQLRRRRAGANVDMLSTRITIDPTEYYAEDGVVNTSYDDLQTGDQIYVDIDQLPTTPPKGLGIAITFNI